MYEISRENIPGSLNFAVCPHGSLVAIGGFVLLVGSVDVRIVETFVHFPFIQPPESYYIFFCHSTQQQLSSLWVVLYIYIYIFFSHMSLIDRLPK